MRMITVNRPVTLSEAAGALKARLGGSYKITPHGGGSRETIDINHAESSPLCASSTMTTPPRSVSTDEV